MKNLKAKLRRDGGFTLVEMLIVVAIIAILIAVSIPMVNGALEKSREATDASNERAFKAELLIAQLSGVIGTGAADTFTAGTVYAYDADEGKLLTNKPTVAYGQATSAGKDTNEHRGYYLVGIVEADGTLKMAWSNASTIPSTVPTDNNLCGGSALYGSTTPAAGG